MENNWKIIKNFPDYKINKFGTVVRIKSASGTKIGKIINSKINRDGYLQLNLYLNKKRYTRTIHRLMLETFIPIDDKLDINHKNGIKSDNRLDNLEWVNKSQNTIHAYKIGLISKQKISENHANFKGENHPQSKLNTKNVICIKKLFKLGFSIKYIANKFPVISINTIYSIKNDKNWSHIKV